MYSHPQDPEVLAPTLLTIDNPVPPDPPAAEHPIL